MVSGTLKVVHFTCLLLLHILGFLSVVPDAREVRHTQDKHEVVHHSKPQSKEVGHHNNQEEVVMWLVEEVASTNLVNWPMPNLVN